MVTVTTVPQRSAVVAFPQIPEQITQVELGLYLSLVGRLEQLEAQVEAAKENLKCRLLSGAIVQPGDHIARLDERSRRNVAWRGVAEDLANTVFGDGKGEAYCEEVLASTKPTVTVSLVVR